MHLMIPCRVQELLHAGRDLVHQELPMVTQDDQLVATLTVTVLAVHALQELQ